MLGSQWGDEGKGKLVDILAQRYDVVARCQGGANAGHTIYDAAGKKYALHLVPSGILNPQAVCVIGNGVVVHLPSLFQEIDALEAAGVQARGGSSWARLSQRLAQPPPLALHSTPGGRPAVAVRPRAPAVRPAQGG